MSSAPRRPIPSDLLSEHDVAELFGRSARTVRRWGDAKVLPYMQVGGQRYYSREAVDAYYVQVEKFAAEVHAAVAEGWFPMAEFASLLTRAIADMRAEKARSADTVPAA